MERRKRTLVAQLILRSVPPNLDRNQDTELLRLLRLTAQRADQLAAECSGTVDPLLLWQQAEEEVLGATLVALS